MSFSLRISETRDRCAQYAHDRSPLGQTSLAPGDPAIARLLWEDGFGTGGALDDRIFTTAVQAKRRQYDGAVFAIVPVYVTSVCVERCLYCNYRLGNKGVEVERLRLSPEDIDREVAYLASEKDLRVMELVYATDPRKRVDQMCRDVERTLSVLGRYGGGTVGINAEALDEHEYRQLKNAGLNFVVLWQETYDRDAYATYHPGNTKKSSYEYRLDAYERMLAAGIGAIGLGVLSGLADWRTDWALLMAHEAYLTETYGVRPAILGVPRLKPAAGALVQTTEHIPSRREFKATLALHNLFSPTTLPFLNTREDWSLCSELAEGGGALFTFNCSTIPGGYAAGRQGYQFPTASFDAPLFAPQLASCGLTPVFDWRFCDGQASVSRNEPAFAAIG